LLGFQQIVVVDTDRIEESNLSRTILYRSEDIGQFKANVAAQAYKKVETGARVQPLVANVTQNCGLGLFAWSDVIIAGLDNREARLWINAAAWGQPAVD
jgi:molybdopterin/thiamine biosynthesis adenylyltransferase